MSKVGVPGTANVYQALGVQSLWGIALHHDCYRRNSSVLVAPVADLTLPIVAISAWWCYSRYGPWVSSCMLGLAQNSCQAAADRVVCLSQDIVGYREQVHPVD